VEKWKRRRGERGEIEEEEGNKVEFSRRRRWRTGRGGEEENEKGK
jgi:hypothetical protein